MDGCEHDYMTIMFNATAETMSETFHLETDNYTCDVNIDVQLHEEDYYWGYSHVAYDNFHFRGPCEQPPSPFTLTYDGMEYEMEYHYSMTPASSPRTTWSGTARVWLTPN